jgi:hypothetical protein
MFCPPASTTTEVAGLNLRSSRLRLTGSARGFSRRNLFYMRRFAALWPECEKVPSATALIGWTAHRVLLDRFAEDPGPYAWYAVRGATDDAAEGTQRKRG